MGGRPHCCGLGHPSLLVFGSGILFSLQGASFKFVEPRGVGALEAIWVRGLIQLLGSTLVLLLRPHARETLAAAYPLKMWLLLRAVAGYGGIFGSFMALERLSLGDAAALLFVAPCISTLLAWLFLRERMSGQELLGVLGAACGIVLIARPPALFGDVGVPISVAGVNLALFGATCAGLVVVLVRKLAQQLEWPVVLIAQAIGQVVLSYPASVALGRSWTIPTDANVVLAMVGGGLCALGGQIALTIGLKGTRVGPASALRTSNMLMSFILQVIVTPSEALHWLSVCGALIVAGSCVLVAIAKMHRSSTKALASSDGAIKSLEPEQASSKLEGVSLQLMTLPSEHGATA